jgi:hypothetical protein
MTSQRLLSFFIRRRRRGGKSLPRIILLGTGLFEDASNGDSAGNLSVRNGSGNTYTFTIISDPDSLFAISGGALDKNGTLDYESAQSHQVLLHADDGAGSVVENWVTVPIKNRAPVLSNATDTKTGQTTATLTFDTTEDTGTLYWIVPASGATLPANNDAGKAQVIAGLDGDGNPAAAHGSQDIATTGTKTVLVTGLTEATVYGGATAVHQEGAPGFLNSNVISGDGFTTDSATSLLLDTVGVSAVRAYSMRKLRDAYAGSAIRIRRSSDDTEQDIGFSGENLDTAAITTFVGANNAFVTKWYDQSGNADDAVQATTANQPRIVNAGTIDTRNGLPAALWPTNNNFELVSASSFTAKEIAAIVATSDAGPNFTGYECVLVGVLGENGVFGTAFDVTYSSGLTNKSVNNDSNTALFNGVLHQVNCNDSAAISFTHANIGGASLGAQWLGWIGEDIAWASQLSSGQRSTLYDNQKAYWGTA